MFTIVHYMISCGVGKRNPTRRQQWIVDYQVLTVHRLDLAM